MPGRRNGFGFLFMGLQKMVLLETWLVPVARFTNKTVCFLVLQRHSFFHWQLWDAEYCRLKEAEARGWSLISLFDLPDFAGVKGFRSEIPKSKKWSKRNHFADGALCIRSEICSPPYAPLVLRECGAKLWTNGSRQSLHLILTIQVALGN